MITVIDNLLTPSYAKAIEEDLLRPEYPWLYLDDVTYNDRTTNPGLVSIIYDRGKPMNEWYPFIKPALYCIADAVSAPITNILRVRIGFLLQEKTQPKPSTPHVDFLYPHYTACYYVNDSDGDTVVYDQTLDNIGVDKTDKIVEDYVSRTEFTVAKSCTPRKGSACIFDGKHFHSSTNPYRNRKRLVLTVNWN